MSTNPSGSGLLRRAGRFLNSVCFDATWNIGVVYAPANRFLEPGFDPPIYWLPCPDRNRFAADPMVVEKNGRIFLLYEDFDFITYRGRIFGCELSPTPQDPPVLAWPPREVFSEPLHLSYPYLFVDRDEVYCVPERAEGREVALYRAVELPHRWERQAVLLADVPAYDSTIFEHDGHWWLLATLPDRRGEPNADLHVWFADRIDGPWQPHPKNPVKSNVASARPAGPPFRHNDELIRPAQDCSQTYGGRIVLQRITRLNPVEFAEEPALAIEPRPNWTYRDGLHTLSGTGDITVIDGKRFFFNRHAFRHNLTAKFGKLRTKLVPHS